MLKKVWIVLKYIKGYKSFAILNIVFNVLSVLFSLFSISMVIPFLSVLFKPVAELTELVSKKPLIFTLTKDGIIDSFYAFLGKIVLDYGKVEALIFICIIVIILFFFKNLFRYLAMFFLAPLRNGVVKDLRNTIMNKVLCLPLAYYSDERKGDIMARATSDVQEVEWTIMTSIEMLFRDPISIVFSLVIMIVISPQLTLFVLVLLPLTGIIIGRVGKSLKKSSVIGQKKLGVLFSVLEETLSGLRVIKAFTAEEIMKKKFEALNDSYVNTMTIMYRRRDLASPLSEFLGTIVMVVLIWFGGNLVISSNAEISPEAFIGFIVIFSQIINPAKSFTTAYFSLQKGVASIERIQHILETDNPIKDIDNPIDIKEFTDRIEYKNVNFSYDKQKDVLKNINFTVEKGKIIALVGESGSGKSTLVDLLPRFYDISNGEILIDGIPIKNYRITDLRNLMGIVTQQSILFNDSVYNNIAFGTKKVTEEEVIKAAKVANAHDFIMNTEHKYYTNIGDGGCKLSGGQKQRLTIARAVLMNPPILILDEATSSLDTESERLVQDALLNLMKNRTSIVIAHRLSTIKNADEIIVIQNGEFVERGTHSELIQKAGAYKRLHDIQMFKD